MYAATKSQPHHLSVGVIARQKDGRYLALRRPDGSLSMMTETLEPGETLVQCALRGLAEEMGVSAEIDAYLGPTYAVVTDQRGTWTKVTLWHLADVTHCALPHSSADGDVEAVWPSDLGAPAHDPVRWPAPEMLA